ncbi:hypothetical protein GDO81_012185 [Engystomops pustulosus]|uniref:Uncharacterized protein n=1 Tax=Engystomops pustulosus TaxID=76066 RepID=A0AAV7BJQ5_ENGPU|nr:hypothetical protein GDO81_012185 [Engystomops pustulosus]
MCPLHKLDFLSPLLDSSIPLRILQNGDTDNESVWLEGNGVIYWSLRRQPKTFNMDRNFVVKHWPLVPPSSFISRLSPHLLS